MKQVAVAFCLVAMSVSTSAAQFYDGNELLLRCVDNKSLVYGYSAGLIDTLAATYFIIDEEGAFRTQKQTVCVPDGATLSQLSDVICKALTDKPETRHWEAAVLARNALGVAFPCQ